MNKYNLFVLLPNNTEEQLVEMSKNISALLQKFGVLVVAEDKIGKRKLAFPIKKVRHAFYTNFILDLENVLKEDADKLWRELRLLPDILRFEVSKFVDQKTELPKLVYREEDVRAPYGANNQYNNSERRENVRKEPEVVEKVMEPTVAEPDLEIKNHKKENKISMEELDQKLDDILSNENV